LDGCSISGQEPAEFCCMRITAFVDILMKAVALFQIQARIRDPPTVLCIFDTFRIDEHETTVNSCMLRFEAIVGWCAQCKALKPHRAGKMCDWSHLAFRCKSCDLGAVVIVQQSSALASPCRQVDHLQLIPRAVQVGGSRMMEETLC
jgi:hypothetical protein